MPSLGQSFHSPPWAVIGMGIYEKFVSFVRPNLKIGAKLEIIWGNEHFNEDFGFLMPSLPLTQNVEH
jgi:hypothetical protein